MRILLFGMEVQVVDGPDADSQREHSGVHGPPVTGWRAVLWCITPALGALLCLAAFDAVGASFLDHYQLRMGSLTFPTVRLVHVMLAWTALGAPFAVLLAWSVLRIQRAERGRRLFERLATGGSDRLWLVAAAGLGLLIPLSIRALALDFGPMADDEWCYRFQAQLMATGRLVAESPPMKMAFDRDFMVNDGRWYAQYFVGWPALLAPGYWIGAPGLMNPLYQGLATAGMFLVIRRLLGSSAARLGAVLACTSPMWVGSASTDMSNTSCLAALVWTTWFALRADEPDAPPWAAVGLAVAFCVAFFIRPTSALGIGLPMGLVWAWRRARARDGAALLRFGLVSAVFAVLFLGVNKVQNGAWGTVSYVRAAAYAREVGYRYMLAFQAHAAYFDQTAVAHFEVERGLSASLAMTAAALLRLSYDMLGWPVGFAFLWLAGGQRWARLLAVTVAWFCLVHLTVLDPGIDSYGPHHYIELGWPLLLLTLIGVQAASRRLAPLGAQVLPWALALAMTLGALLRYDGIRLSAMADAAAQATWPEREAARLGLTDAIVFTTPPFRPSQKCQMARANSWVLYPPGNDPDLRNPVLWANHATLADDHALLEKFPGRAGYIGLWTEDCNVVIAPLPAVGAPAPTP